MFRNKTPKYWRNLILFAFVCFLIAFIGFWVDVAHDRALWVIDPWPSSPKISPADDGIPVWEEITFTTPDGLQISGWFYPPAPEKDYAVIIILHGHAGHRGALMADAKILNSHGYGCLLIDMRNHGKSEGEFTSFGLYEWQDVQGAVNYLQERADVNPNKIGLMGHSMGGAAAIFSAANIPEIKAVIAESSFATVQDNIASGVRQLAQLPSFPFAPIIIWFGERETGIDLHNVRPIDQVSRISPRPILFIHGELDPTIPAENSFRLYEAAQEPKSLYIIAGAGHGLLPQDGGAEYEQIIISFFDNAFSNP